MATELERPILPPGIYRIFVADSVEPQCLTNGGDYVTILPPGARPDKEQEWRITPARNGNIFIERPSNIFPATYLTYKGAPEPKEGKQIDLRVSEFPLYEWHYSPRPGYRYLLRVPGSELGIRAGPLTIHPPHLVLGYEGQLEWRFERLPRDEE